MRESRLLREGGRPGPTLYSPQQTYRGAHPHESKDVGTHGDGTGGPPTDGTGRCLAHDFTKREWLLCLTILLLRGGEGGRAIAASGRHDVCL